MPIFVAAATAALQPAALLGALRLRAPSLVPKEDLLPAAALSALSREEAAAVDLGVTLQARAFLGHSETPLTFLAVLQRRNGWGGGGGGGPLHAGWYNGGGLPLETLYPLVPLAWAFTAHGGLAREEERALQVRWGARGAPRGGIRPALTGACASPPLHRCPCGVASPRGACSATASGGAHPPRFRAGSPAWAS